MYNAEKAGLKPSKEANDGGLGLTDAFQGCLEDVLKNMREVQCNFLGSKAAEAVLPKCEVKKDESGEYLAFAAATDAKKPERQEQPERHEKFDQWLDGKTRLQPLAA